jgi:uridine kinase
MSPFILGVAGGSGSGKTFFVKDLCQRLGQHQVGVLFQDDFYKDQSSRFDFDGGSVNFDHPSSLDFGLLAEKLSDLKNGQDIQIPQYDFAKHQRLEKAKLFTARPLILVDGILILHSREVRDQLDASVFFDAPEELRFSRRLERDIKERGRTADGVFSQFYKQVQPMHQEYVQPSKKFARWTVQDFEFYEEGLLKIETFLRMQLGLESLEKARLL